MFDNLLLFLVMGCATWRVSYMLLYERGPFDLFIEIREGIGIGHYQDGKPSSYPETFFGLLFSCVYCMSVWIAGAFVLLALLSQLIAYWLALPFAVSALAMLIDTKIVSD